MSARHSATRKNAVAAGFRSGFEQRVLEAAADAGAAFEYEPASIPYAHHVLRRYLPDAVLANGIVLELKGRFTAADRTKMLLVKRQHPTLDIRIVFQNANAKLNKTSKTTYAKWAEANGFPYSHQIIPAAWLAEGESTSP